MISSELHLLICFTWINTKLALFDFIWFDFDIYLECNLLYMNSTWMISINR